MRFNQNSHNYLRADTESGGLIIEPHGDDFRMMTFSTASAPVITVTRDEMVELTRRLVQQFPEALDD